MNDNQIILNKLNNSEKKKKQLLIIIGVAALVILLAVIMILLFHPKRRTETPKYNTSLTGDAKDDPENADVFEDDGANVNATELVADKEKSNGIDVSKWQGKIDWAKVSQSGIEFAFIRIGYRGENGIIYRDDNADYNIQQAQKNNVLVGVYFFSTAKTTDEAIEEAQWTAQAIAGYNISYPVVYDCEGFERVSSRMFKIGKKERTENALAFLKEIKKADYEPMFYSALNDLTDSAKWDIKKIEKSYKVWVAQYPDETYPQKTAPDYNRIFHAWQYTNNGTVSGISGNVDMVVCYFKNKKAEVKDHSATPVTAAAPLTNEEKLYKTVNETVTAKDETNLRTAATTKSDVVLLLKHGQTVARIGIGSNGWSKLNYNGQTVYAITSYLTTDLNADKPQNTPSGKDIVEGQTFTANYDSVTAKIEVNLRALPNTDSEIVGKLTSGNFLSRTAVSDKGWSRLLYNGKTVYALTSYLTDKAGNTDSGTITPSDGFTPVEEQVTAKEETNLRTSPSTQGSEVVYLLKNGEVVKRIGINSTSGWSKLEYNGQIVYAVSSMLAGM